MTFPSTGKVFFAGVLATFMLTESRPANAVGAPFSCPSEIDFVSQGTPDTQLYELTYGAGSATDSTLGSAQAETWNALGYDAVSGYLYAMDLDGPGAGAAGTLYQIDSTGTATSLGVVSGYTAANGQPGDGAFDSSGNYWITGGNGSTKAYEIDVTSTPPAVTATLTLSAAWEPIDFTYADGFMWGLSGTNIYRLDLTTGTVSTYAAPPGVANGNYGAAWTGTNGDLGFLNNGTGEIYKISVNPAATNPTFALVASYAGAVAGANNDGAACPATADVDLGVAKSGPTSIAPGGTITWTLTATNDGPGDSSGFAIADVVPGSVTNVASTTPGCVVTGNRVLCSEGALADGDSFAVTLTGTAPANSDNCFTNTATVTGNETDPNASNDASSVETCTEGISVVKSVTSTGPYNTVGQTITYSFVVKNTGGSALTSVGVTDSQTAPAGALATGPTCQSLSAPTGTCSGSTTTLAAGQSATFTGTYMITQADLNNGSVSDSATASGTPPGCAVTSCVLTSRASTAEVTLTQSPSLSVTKTVTSTGPYNAVGQTISYRFLATNTGNVTLRGVGITDTQSAPAGALTSGPTCQSLGLPAGVCSGATTTLLVGQSAIFTGTYTITQNDLNNGSVSDSAIATGEPPGCTSATCTVASAASSAEVSLSQSPAISVTKSVTSSGPYNAVGQTITYKFVATNTGNVTLSAAGITDSQAAPAGALTAGPTCQSLASPTGTCSGSTATLLPGQSATFTGTYAISQADLNKGSVSDSATASAQPPRCGSVACGVVSPASTAEVSLTQSPALGITKSVTSTGPYNAVGQAIIYSFVATNTGNVALSAVGVSDTQTAPAGALTTGPTCQSLASPTGSCSGATTLLLPGQTATFTATYTISQTDLNNGSVSDSATASGTPPGCNSNGCAITSPASTVDVATTQSPALTVVKSVTSTGPYNAVGQVITYSFVATNTGNVTLSSVGIADTQASPASALTTGPTCTSLASPPGACTGSTTTLLPGQAATFTGSYTISQTDLNNGAVSDSATASGTPPGSVMQVTSGASSATVVFAESPSLTLAKSPTTTTYEAVGDTVSYNFIVTNVGNVTLHGISVTDTETPPATQSNLSAISCPPSSLAPLASKTCTATYTVTQADLDNGTVSDSASASGIPPGSMTPITSAASSATVSATQWPAITLTESSATTGYSAVGDLISYQYLVTNTGNVTLNTVSVDDAEDPPATQANLSAIDCPDSSLAPGDSETCTATYTVTQADLDKGSVSDVSTASGLPPGSAPLAVSAPSGTTVSASQASSLTVAGSSTTMSYSAVGNTLSFSFLVTNAGNVTLSGIDVTATEAAPATQGNLSAITCPDASLGAGASETCTATYTVTQADLDHGSVRTSATASGTPAGSANPITSPSASFSVSAAVSSALTVAKSSPTVGYAAVGSTVAYNFLVTNTGNVTLRGISVTDVESAPATQANLSSVTCPVSSLSPAASETCTATYTVTQADLDNGFVSDSATASGTPPGSMTPVTSAASSATVTASGSPSLTLADSSTTASYSAVGDTIAYQYLVTNVGNVTLSNITVADNEEAPATQANLSAVDCADAALTPGASETCTATYTVTQADLDNGSVTDLATASGTPPGSAIPELSMASGTTVSASQSAALTIEGSSTTPTYSSAGNILSYAFVVTNTGNVTLFGITVNDTQAAPASQANLAAISCPYATLAPGGNETCTASYSVTQADVDHGSVHSSCTASGSLPGSQTPVTSEASSFSVAAAQSASLTVAKSSTTASFAAVGSILSYSFLVTNTGNVTLRGIGVNDLELAPGTQGNLSSVTCPATSLAPATSETCAATYAATQADLDNGSVSDSATASGTPPGSMTPVTSAVSSATVTANQLPSLAIVTSSTTTGYSAAGDTISYQYVVTNTGNVTLSGITVNDTQAAPASQGNLSAISCPGTSLAPGANETCTATYGVTQADLENGLVSNSATASGTPPGSSTPVISAASGVTVDASPAGDGGQWLTDAGPLSGDAGPMVDAGELADAGQIIDAGESGADAGVAPGDAGEPTDAGEQNADAGEPPGDAGNFLDAGVVSDAGAVQADAGGTVAAPDGGEELVSLRGGCACNGGDTGVTLALLGPLALVLRRRRSVPRR